MSPSQSKAQLLIEILTEELPAHSVNKNLTSIISIWKDILKSNGLKCDDLVHNNGVYSWDSFIVQDCNARVNDSLEFYFTPRRLVIIDKEFPLESATSIIEAFGPPLSICYDNEGKPTRAMQSFLDKQGISQDEPQKIHKDGKEVLYYKTQKIGKKSEDMLGELVAQWLERLDFGKSMRWGEGKYSFIRPIRNICIMLDSKLVALEAYGLESSSLIVAHRQAKNRTKSISDIESYREFLENNGVILEQKRRKEIIINGIRALEKEHDIRVEIDEELLEEVVAITEYPSVLMGHFESEFLQIPKEMIITSMKDNQRYFPVYKGDNLYSGFVFVSNALIEDRDFSLIIKGNEKVLRARLSDALFFYTKDLEANMDFGNLSSIGFIQGGGSMEDKVERERALMNTLANEIGGFSSEELALCDKAINLCKRDLKSKSVGEFAELQGIMGSYFAAKCGEDERVCLAIREQYLPHGLDTNLPSTRLSALVNISIKLDTTLTLFALDKIPSGSKDPFALRRQMAAMLRICHKFGFNISIKTLCKLASKNESRLEEFIADRIYGIFSHINRSVVRSVLTRGFGIQESFDKIEALGAYINDENIKSIISTFKRVANISDSNETSINTSLFEEYERNLHEKLLSHKSMTFNTYKDELESLFTLKESLDSMFENVLVNSEDTALRNNRVALVRLVFDEFLKFGDMREISAI